MVFRSLVKYVINVSLILFGDDKMGAFWAGVLIIKCSWITYRVWEIDWYKIAYIKMTAVGNVGGRHSRVVKEWTLYSQKNRGWPETKSGGDVTTVFKKWIELQDIRRRKPTRAHSCVWFILTQVFSNICSNSTIYAIEFQAGRM